MKSDFLPIFTNNDEVLVPIKIDTTHKGARYVDSFIWDICQPILTADEFATRTCCDLNLPGVYMEDLYTQALVKYIIDIFFLNLHNIFRWLSLEDCSSIARTDKRI